MWELIIGILIIAYIAGAIYLIWSREKINK